MQLEIRPYECGDYDLLIALWEQAALPYKPEGRDRREHIEKEMAAATGQIFFAYFQQQAVGTVLVTHDGRKGWINRVAVLKDFRKQGVARQLVERAEQWLDDAGIHIYACQIEAYNRSSFEAFQQMGYVPFEGMHYLTKRKYPEV